MSPKSVIEEIAGPDPAAFAAKVSEAVWAKIGNKLDDQLVAQQKQWEVKVRTSMDAVREEQQNLTAAAANAEDNGDTQNPKDLPESFSKAINVFSKVAKEKSEGPVTGWARLTKASEDKEEAYEEARAAREKQQNQREKMMATCNADEIFGLDPNRMSRASRNSKAQKLSSKELDAPKSLKECFYDRNGELPQTFRDFEEMCSRLRTYIAPRLLIPPDSYFRWQWDALSIVFVVYTMAIVPYRTCFVQRHLLLYSVIDVLIDSFFICDVVLNFFTSYLHDGYVINSYHKIAKNYARSWLAVDLLATAPFDWMLYGVAFSDPADDPNAPSNYRRRRALETVRLLRLLRVARLYRYIHRYEDKLAFVSGHVLRLCNVTGAMAFSAHWAGCFQYMLATFEAVWYFDAENKTNVIVFNPDSWVSRLQRDGVIVEQQDAWEWSYFDAWTMMLSMSSGIRDPKRTVELWGFIAVILFGASLSALFIAALTTAISESDASAKDYRTKIDMVRQYMRHAQLPRALRTKISLYFELRFPSKRSFDEDGIMAEVSHPLREEIALHKCKQVLSALQVVDSSVKGLEGAISQRLERVVFVAGDYIIRAGEETEGMYFVSGGHVEVIAEDGTIIKTLTSNAFFGEMALLDPEGRAAADVRVKTFCEGYKLSKSAFEKITHSYPTFKEYLESAKKLRVKAEVQMREKSKRKGGKGGATKRGPKL